MALCAFQECMRATQRKERYCELHRSAPIVGQCARCGCRTTCWHCRRDEAPKNDDLIRERRTLVLQIREILGLRPNDDMIREIERLVAFERAMGLRREDRPPLKPRVDGQGS